MAMFLAVIVAVLAPMLLLVTGLPIFTWVAALAVLALLVCLVGTWTARA